VGFLNVSGLIVPTGRGWHTMYGLSPLNIQKQELAVMEADDTITVIVQVYNTPGGIAQGLSAHWNYIKSMSTKTYGFVMGQSASAGYFIMSANDTIVADELATVGSIGALVQFVRREGAMRQAGYEPVTFVSEQSPLKVATDPKNAPVMQKFVNDLAEIFVGYAAKGRNVSVETVKETFGKGAMVLATQAKTLGMIDEVKDFDQLVGGLVIEETNGIVELNGANMSNGTPDAGSSEEGESSMNTEELKAQYPDLVKQILASAATEAGTVATTAAQERITSIMALREEMKDASPMAKAAAETVITAALLNAEATVDATKAEMFQAAFKAKEGVTEALDEHGEQVAQAAADMGNLTPGKSGAMGDEGKKSVFMTAFENLDKAGIIGGGKE